MTTRRLASKASERTGSGSFEFGAWFRLCQFLVAVILFSVTAALFVKGAGALGDDLRSRALRWAGSGIVLILLHFFYGLFCALLDRQISRVHSQWLGTACLYAAVCLFLGLLQRAGLSADIGLLSPGVAGSFLAGLLPRVVGAVGTILAGLCLVFLAAFYYGHLDAAGVARLREKFAALRLPSLSRLGHDINGDGLAEGAPAEQAEDEAADAAAAWQSSDAAAQPEEQGGQDEETPAGDDSAETAGGVVEGTGQAVFSNIFSTRRSEPRPYSDREVENTAARRRHDTDVRPEVRVGLDADTARAGATSQTAGEVKVSERRAAFSGVSASRGVFAQETAAGGGTSQSGVFALRDEEPRRFSDGEGESAAAGRHEAEVRIDARGIFEDEAAAADETFQTAGEVKEGEPQAVAANLFFSRAEEPWTGADSGESAAAGEVDRESEIPDVRDVRDEEENFSQEQETVGSGRDEDARLHENAKPDGPAALNSAENMSEGDAADEEPAKAPAEPLCGTPAEIVTETPLVQPQSQAPEAAVPQPPQTPAVPVTKEPSVETEPDGELAGAEEERAPEAVRPAPQEVPVTPVIKEPSVEVESSDALAGAEETTAAEPKIAPGTFPPPLDLLGPHQEVCETVDDGQAQEKGRAVIKALDSFGVSAELKRTIIGPTVVQYQIQLAPGVKFSKVSALGRDIAITLGVASAFVETPIPGTSYIGIDLPNVNRRAVPLRQILESEVFQNTKLKLPLPLGQTVDGRILISGLEELPHLLIAGTTGSGKSIFVNNCIVSMCWHNTPEELRFIMVDPKRVEMGIYESLPHILAKPIVTPEAAVHALAWAVREMENRYDKCSAEKVRSLAAYNEKVLPKDRLPHIVIIVDELADLMMTAQKNVEEYIMRLSQMARAVGIHLMLATQRPSVNVLTGTIKANIPARVSFSLPSVADSRTILDSGGAQYLLGKGDMLFVSTRTRTQMLYPLRIQSPFMDEQTNIRVVEYLRSTFGDPQYVDLDQQTEDQGGGRSSDFLEDSRLEEAIKIVLGTGVASSSGLQRQMRIGFTRAARMIDTMEAMGIVGPQNGAKPREILVDEAEALEILDGQRGM